MILYPFLAEFRLLGCQPHRHGLTPQLVTPLVVRTMKARWPAHATARRLTARHEAFHDTAGADEIQLEQSLLEFVIGALGVLQTSS